MFKQLECLQNTQNLVTPFTPVVSNIKNNNAIELDKKLEEFGIDFDGMTLENMEIFNSVDDPENSINSQYKLVSSEEREGVLTKDEFKYEKNEEDYIFCNYGDNNVNDDFVQLTPPVVDFDKINVSENAIDISVCFNNDNNNFLLSQVLSHAERNPMFNQLSFNRKLLGDDEEELLPLIYDDFEDPKLSLFPPIKKEDGITIRNLDESHTCVQKSPMLHASPADENDKFIKTNCSFSEMKAKKRKVHLSIKSMVDKEEINDLDTPEIIDCILDFDSSINSRLSFNEVI